VSKLKEETFKDCPRCGRKVLKEKTICSFCGMVLKDKKGSGEDKIFGQEHGKGKVRACPICGKPPEETTFCPNCGVEGICGYHLYKFFEDER
jgi:ribosomal protein L37E